METPYKPSSFEGKESVENVPNPNLEVEQREQSNHLSGSSPEKEIKQRESTLASPESASTGQTIDGDKAKKEIEPIRSIPDKPTPQSLESTILGIIERNNQQQ